MDEESSQIEINIDGEDSPPIECSPQQESTIIKKGFMIKKGHIRHNWKSRWFLLLPDKLCYYKSKGDLIPKGTILLKGASVISPDPEYTKKECVFRVIEIKGTEYLLQCSDDNQREEWVKTITNTIRKLNTVVKKNNSVKLSDRPTINSPAPSPETVKKNSDVDSLVILQNRVTLEDLLQAMQDKEAGLQLKTLKIGEEVCKLCFSGESLISWLLSWGFVNSRKEGTVIAGELLEKAYLHPIGQSDVAWLDTLSRTTARKAFDDSDDSYYRYSAFLNSNIQIDMDDEDSNDDDSDEESIIDNLQATVVKEGFLVKKGLRHRHNWKLRKFILYDEPIRLAYFNPTKGVKKRKGKIRLFGSQVHLLKTDDEKEDKCFGFTKENKKILRDHCFMIQTRKGKEHILQAPSEDEMNSWVKQVESLIEKYESYGDT